MRQRLGQLELLLRQLLERQLGLLLGLPLVRQQALQQQALQQQALQLRGRALQQVLQLLLFCHKRITLLRR